MGKYFGTDGIRGLTGGTLMNETFVHRLGLALGRYLRQQFPDQSIRVVIGRDTRASGPLFTDVLTWGLNQWNVSVLDLGVVPTPSIARSVLQEQADFGIAVTASHNPVSDNGIKLFDKDACKLYEDAERQIEALIDAETEPTSDHSSTRESLSNNAAGYVNFIQSLIAPGSLSGWKIVLDLANGGTSETSPAVFEHCGAELVLIGDRPNGENINDGVGSEYPESLCETVVKHGANIGIAHDGDGDRLVVCDENGLVLEGDVLLGLFAVHALRSGTLKKNTFVATIQSNLGLDHAVKSHGGRVVRANVGDRNVAHLMREVGANVGGESSGHIIFSDLSTTGDGLLAAVKLVELMCKAGVPLSELRREIPLFPQETFSLNVAEKKPLESLETLNKSIADIQQKLGAEGRVLVRYSGTECKLRLLVEGKDANQVAAFLADLKKAACSDLDMIVN